MWLSHVHVIVSGLDIKMSLGVWSSEFMESNETFLLKAYSSTALQIVSLELKHAQWSAEFLSTNVQTLTSTFFIKRALTNFAFLFRHPMINGVLPNVSCWLMLILKTLAWSIINFANIGSSSQAEKKTINECNFDLCDLYQAPTPHIDEDSLKMVLHMKDGFQFVEVGANLYSR